MTELEETRNRLRRKLDLEVKKRLIPYDEYMEGEQALKFIAPALRDELGERLTTLVIELPRAAVAAYDERLDVTGFRRVGVADATEADKQMWSDWLANDGDVLSQQVNQESLALGRSYMIVGPGDDEVPLITAESAFDTIHEDDPRTHEVRNGYHRWTELDGSYWETVYTVNGRTTWWRPKGRGQEWRVEQQVENIAKICSLVPFPNQPRILGRLRAGRPDVRLGRSEFHSIMTIVDAINKMATDMMISGEFHAMPRRWAFGLKPEDFEDENGNPITAWGRKAGDLWASADKEVKVGQFKEADLKNFRDTVKMLMQIAGQLLALPGYYSAFETINPPSGDSIRAAEVQIVKRSERKQTVLGNRYGRVQRLAIAERTGRDDISTREIQTLWRDPSTPTRAQAADATSKLVTTRDGKGRSIVPVEQAREDLGYTQAQREKMAEYDAAADPQVAAAMRTLEQAGGGSRGGA